MLCIVCEKEIKDGKVCKCDPKPPRNRAQSKAEAFCQKLDDAEFIKGEEDDRIERHRNTRSVRRYR